MTSTTIKKKLEDVAGRICEVLIPIKHEYYMGKGSRIAICTLSSMYLLQSIARTDDIMNRILIVGRLLSENKGIDSLVRYVVSNENLSIIILCGKDTMGHKPGHSLLCLHKNGIDENHKIIGSSSPHPFLMVTKTQVSKFQRQVKIINKIGEANISNIKNIVESQ